MTNLLCNSRYKFIMKQRKKVASASKNAATAMIKTYSSKDLPAE